MNEKSGSTFWLFLEMTARRRAIIVWFTIVVTVLAALISLILPTWYEAKVLLLPPKDSTMPIPELSQLAEVTSVTQGLDLPVMVTPSDIYARMLTSRTITDTIIDRFDLVNRYDVRNRKKALEELMYLSRFFVTDEGLIEIAVEDTDPDTAAAMANMFVDELIRLNEKIAADRARSNRDFIGDRLDEVKMALDSARSRLEEFQMENKAIDFDEQTRLAIEQAATLKVSLAEVELKLALKEKKLGKDNAELIELRREREVIRGQLDRLETTNADSSFFSLPVASIPSLKGQYEALYSSVRVNETLYDLLLRQSEQAKIAENDKGSTISVLDRAVPPEEKSRPRRSRIVAGAFVISLILSILIAATIDYVARLADVSPDDYRRAQSFIGAFFGWLPGIKKSK